MSGDILDKNKKAHVPQLPCVAYFFTQKFVSGCRIAWPHAHDAHGTDLRTELKLAALEMVALQE